MDTQHLSIFVDVVRRGSFAAVAKERNLDPATVSRSIAALKEALQLRLFQRTTRRVEPTEAGRVYFERVEPIVEQLQAARLSASDVGQRPGGVLRLSCPVSFAQLNVTPLLAEFSLRYPDLRYELVLTDTSLDLIREGVDVAIRIGSLEDSSMICEKLATMRMRVCATHHYLENHGRPQRPEELSQHRCLLLAMPGFARSDWKFTDRRGRRKVVAVPEFLRTSNALALKQCALNHMGVVLQATWIVGKELEAGTLVDLFPDYEVTAAQHESAAWAVYPSRAYIPQKVKIFLDFLREKFRQGAPWES